MNLFYQPRLSEGITYLEGDEAHHALRVLRLRIGDLIFVTDGKGIMAHAAITSTDQDSCNFKISQQATSTRPFEINLFVAPTKNSDRMEWLVEKATEIGVSSITMMRCERSERKQISHERLVKMAISAMKQSQQSFLPEVNDITSFDEIIEKTFGQKFIAFVDQTNPDHLKNLVAPGVKYAILIGPEGDFTQQEIDRALELNWKKVSLGPTRLRTETAALTATLTFVLANT
ncbi:MAG TPA: 16S rRNA (uracil(1498)-N(3))-methyltransferase [Cyclobacteriaceae bacterium]|nr:16S rRNA (uracil(1498)-N(3))-methyltransferase [Cyclobacteriaceae bacterium]